MITRRRLRTAALTLTLAAAAPLSIAVTGPSAAASVDPADPGQVSDLLDDIVPAQLDEYAIPGAAVVVVADGRQVAAEGYGTADVERGTPVDAGSTAFFMASVAKVFTATAVMQLVEQGELDLHTDVNEYLPGFQIEDTYPGRPVTLHHLLTHTGGFDNAILGRSSADAEHAGELGESLAEHQPERVRPPGDVASYDNYGFALAGYIVEAVSGEPYEEYVQRHILTPLDMTRTSFAQPYAPAEPAEPAHGYRPAGSTAADGQVIARGQHGAWSPTGAGALATVDDMGRFLLAQLGSGGERILGRDAAAQMKQRQYGNDPRLPGLGYALEQRTFNGRPALVKDGDLPGFHTNMALLPEQQVGIYVAYNGDGVSGSAAHAADEIVARLADHFGPAGNAPERTGDAGVDTDALAGTYRASTTGNNDLTRAAALTGSVTVEAGDAGSLITTGPLSGDPEVTTQHWDPVGDGVFRERDGQDRIAFEIGADGTATALTSAAQPTAAFERLEWHESPMLHQIVLLASFAVLVVSMLGWAGTALIRRLRSTGSRGRGPRLARLLVAGTAASATAMIGCFVSLVADGNAMNEAVMLGDSPMLVVVPALGALVAVAAVLAVACAVFAWTRRWWGPLARLHFTGTALAALLFAVVVAEYNLAGLGVPG